MPATLRGSALPVSRPAMAGLVLALRLGWRPSPRGTSAAQAGSRQRRERRDQHRDSTLAISDRVRRPRTAWGALRALTAQLARPELADAVAGLPGPFRSLDPLDQAARLRSIQSGRHRARSSNGSGTSRAPPRGFPAMGIIRWRRIAPVTIATPVWFTSWPGSSGCDPGRHVDLDAPVK